MKKRPLLDLLFSGKNEVILKDDVKTLNIHKAAMVWADDVRRVLRQLSFPGYTNR